MDKRRSLNILFFVFFLLFFVFFDNLNPFLLTQGMAASEEHATYPEPEARAWLKDPQRQVSFVSQRFADTKEALRFIDKLYAAGAIYVGIFYVMGDANALKIYLPIKHERRDVIFKIGNRERTRSGYGEEDDHGQDELKIWF